MATLQYKCRRCNVLMDDMIDTDDAIEKLLTRKLSESIAHGDFMAAMFKEWKLHNCDDNGYGVIDVAGYKP